MTLFETRTAVMRYDAGREEQALAYLWKCLRPQERREKEPS
jgi:hypothetical protein